MWGDESAFRAVLLGAGTAMREAVGLAGGTVVAEADWGEPDAPDADTILVLDLGGAGSGGRGDVDEQVAEVLLVQGDGVAGRVAAVGLGHELVADGHLGGQAHNRHVDPVLDEGAQRVVDIAGVAG